MRGPERRAADERSRGQRTAGGRVDACHRERLVGAERGQETGEPLGQHRVARTGRPDHQEMVRAGGRHLEGAPARGPGRGRRRDQVPGRRRSRSAPAVVAARPIGPAAPEPARPASPPRGPDRHARAPPRAGRTGARPGPTSPWRQPGRSCPGRRRSDPLSPSSPLKASPSVLVGLLLAGGDEQADSDGKIEAGAALAHARRGQVDGDPTERPGQTAREGQRHGRVACSRTAASGSPTMVNPGSPLETWTSTETGRPTAPFSVADAMAATMRRTVETLTGPCTYGWRGSQAAHDPRKLRRSPS